MLGPTEATYIDSPSVLPRQAPEHVSSWRIKRAQVGQESQTSPILWTTAISAVGQFQIATVAFPTKQRVSKVEHLSTGCMRDRIYIEIYVKGHS